MHPRCSVASSNSCPRQSARTQNVGLEWLSERSRTDAVHDSWLEVHENRVGHVVVIGSLIAVHADALKLEVRVVGVCAREDLFEMVISRSDGLRR